MASRVVEVIVLIHMEIRNRDEKTAVGMNLRSHSLDKLRQIVTTGALTGVKQKALHL
jgi:hypothetical protein